MSARIRKLDAGELVSLHPFLSLGGATVSGALKRPLEVTNSLIRCCGGLEDLMSPEFPLHLFGLLSRLKVDQGSTEYRPTE